MDHINAQHRIYKPEQRDKAIRLRHHSEDRPTNEDEEKSDPESNRTLHIQVNLVSS